MVETKPETLNTSAEGDHEPHYDPVVTLPLKEIKTLEEDETELFKMRAKLYRWAGDSEPPEWKERGAGDVKFLQHKETERVRLLMRRDKTLKVCANHFVEEYMDLTPHCGSERAWLYNAHADYTDEEAKEELFAIRFSNPEKAKEFKEMFNKCKEMNKKFSKDETTQDVKNKTEKSEVKEDDLETATDNLEALKIEKKNKEESEVQNGNEETAKIIENSESEEKNAKTEENAENECTSSPEK